MDIATYLQCFESNLSSYTGDDPLDPWEKFVEYLEQRVPADGASGMSLVFDNLVQRFLHVERYANDIRYVNYCIKCASYYSEPQELFSHLYSKGIGTKVATLYVAWAQQFEQRGMNEQADAVYQKAMENQAQPADTLLHEYREFQMRTSRNQTPVTGSRTPLQNSHLVNQMSTHREPVAQSKATMDCQSKQPTVIVSRSEYSGVSISSQNSGVQFVSEYIKEELVCEGSELCFEEVRAAKYFRKLQEKLERERTEQLERQRVEQLEMQRVEQLEKQRLEQLERQRMEHLERQHMEQLERQRVEQLERQRMEHLERQHMEQLERERMEQLEREQLETQRMEQLERERMEQLERQRMEQLQREQLETQRMEQLERERMEQLERERMEQLERQRMEQLDREGIEQLEKKHLEMMKKEEGILSFRWLLKKSNQELEAAVPSSAFTWQLSKAEAAVALNACNTQQSLQRPQTSNCHSSRHSLGLSLHSEPNFVQDTGVTAEPQGRTLSSEVSHHPSVLPGSRVSLPTLAPPSVSTDQASVTQASVVQPQLAQQPDIFEQSHLAVQRHAQISDVNAVLCQDDRPLPSSFHEQEEKLHVSQGNTANLSHITPNNSLGFIQATPSRVQPSPTVNTREALDVIMDMFQAPTLLEDPCHNSSVQHANENYFGVGYPGNGGAPSFSKPPTTAAFTIFQDNDDKENCRAAAAPAPAPAPAVLQKAKPPRVLSEISGSKSDKPNETPSELMMPDENTMWGAHYNALNSLAACPNSTTDFAMSAQFVSTPFTRKAPFFSDSYVEQENNCVTEDNAYIRRQSKKLSPIIEQSPDETLSETATSQVVPSSVRQGTIVGEGLAAAQHCLTTSSITMVQPPPPAVLSFRDQTAGPTDSSILRSPKTTGPGWNVYISPEQPSKPDSVSSRINESSFKPTSKPVTIKEELDKPSSRTAASEPSVDVPMSPQCAPRMDWLAIRSPEIIPEPDLEPDLDAFLCPHQSKTIQAFPHHNLDVPMSPQQPQVWAEVPMSPMQQQPEFNVVDEPMSPERGLTCTADERINPKAPTSASGPMVEDPWSDEMIAGLLSALTVPLNTHPRCITWQCQMPSITPKSTISMGKASLRVDCIIGEGAFAAVYQATDPKTSEKMVLKVQKPGNPWEFYINTQLDARLQLGVRHLYSNIYSAHLFHNGSVLLGELHNYGTLLNAVNLYKNMSDKVMPQPLVMYFTICILHMVEQLHNIHIVHADIKPDNFLLGERFLENKCFEPENMEHGLALIDFGQSIDMELFPKGTAFTARCLTSGFQCTEMLSGKPWNYQTDYFGIAGTVYCMLFGTYMQVTNENGMWKTNAVFRRNPHSDLWLEFFHTLLNVPDCRSLPSLQSLRCKLTDTLQQNYSNKLTTLKSRLLVLLLESHKSARR